MTFSFRPHQQRGLTAMENHSKGSLLMPTGAGKTLVMIFDAMRQFQSETPQTIVVVAPRILLAEQLSSEFLEFITNASVIHCHTGETHHFSSTNPIVLRGWTEVTSGHKLIFTTYHSLYRLQEADISVNTIYFDEAHNSVKRNFFPATEYFSQESQRSYFFTATRKTSTTLTKPGMNDLEVYGDIICTVSAPELVNGGFIVPPKIRSKKFEIKSNKEINVNCDNENLLNTIDEIDCKKVLVCVKAVKSLVNLMSHTDFCHQLKERGYSYLYITSKTGAIIDGKKVNREVFFETLNKWGKDPFKKFVCLQRSILSEGINVSALEAVIFLRNMDIIEMTQNIGRVLRKGDASKIFGLCVVPVYSNSGIATEKLLQQVVNTVFEKGQILDSVIKK